MEDYASMGRRRKMALEATAIRTRAPGLAELVAYIATGGTAGLHETIVSVRTGRDLSVEPEWLARLGRIVGLVPELNFDRDDAISILEKAIPEVGYSNSLRFRQLLIDLLFAQRRYVEAHDALGRSPDLMTIERGYLGTDLLNPFIASPFADRVGWMEGFNRHFHAFDLEPVDLREGDGTPFDRVACRTGPSGIEGPLVSVIMTVYRTASVALVSAVNSVLSQTYQNIELVIVDDGSGEEYQEYINEVSKIDPRIRIELSERNEGTYVARNRGLSVAQGTYVTGQDADDWSHPRRIEHQVALLESEASIPGVRTSALFVSDYLVAGRVGYTPLAPNASSFMARRADMGELGGYLRARRASDNELVRRFEAAYGSQVRDVPGPLSLCRVSPDSLSRSDFRAGWRHPARSAFVHAYSLWHESANGDWNKLALQSSVSPVPIPQRFRVNVGTPEYDVVFMADWRHLEETQRSVLDEIEALRTTNLRLGILHVESSRFASTDAGALCRPVQELINSAVVDQVLLDDSTKVRCLVVRQPSVLQFPPGTKSGLDVERVLLSTEEAPAEHDGSDICYRIVDCTRNARSMFGVEPAWLPLGPSMRSTIQQDAPSERILRADAKGVISVATWHTPRTRFRSDRPVVGRYSSEGAMRWPGSRAALRSVYPTDGSVDVRIMGGWKAARAILRIDAAPSGWLVFAPGEILIRPFLNSIDFFLYYPNESSMEVDGRGILEAAAAGVVPILPHQFAPTFGPAAVYAEPEDAMQTVERLFGDSVLYRAQVRQGQNHVAAMFDYRAYRELVLHELDLGAANGVA